MKTIREFFGLSQYKIADILKMARSHLSMYERGERPAPSQLYSLQGRMTNAFTAAQKLYKENLNVEKPFITDEIKQKLRVRHLEKHKLYNRLEEMKKAFASYYQREEGLEQLKMIAEPEDEKIIILIQGELAKVYERNGPEEQLYLGMQIAGIEAEVNFIKEHMQGHEDSFPAFLK